MKLEELQSRGFDKSREAEDGYIRVSCSCCLALVCNGTPLHELGCPNSPLRAEDTDDE